MEYNWITLEQAWFNGDIIALRWKTANADTPKRTNLKETEPKGTTYTTWREKKIDLMCCAGKFLCIYASYVSVACGWVRAFVLVFVLVRSKWKGKAACGTTGLWIVSLNQQRKKEKNIRKKKERYAQGWV